MRYKAVYQVERGKRLGLEFHAENYNMAKHYAKQHSYSRGTLLAVYNVEPYDCYADVESEVNNDF